jgi:hypothetical protein
MKQIFDALVTSIQILPVLLTGHDLAHSNWHFLGLHLSGLIIATLNLSVSMSKNFWSECFYPYL